ncbi:MAG: transketolase [Candidatus Saccharibacteria bacterium]|nr:transketolase [Candidatus Saccharibacteria bacterium]
MNYPDAELVANVRNHARNMRRHIIRMLAAAKSGHTAGSLDLADIIASLYFGAMNFDEANDGASRDLLVLSNGHTVPVLYAAMAEKGLLSTDELMTLRQFGSRLQGHPERMMLPQLETTSGPLGEGLSQAAGMAYSLKYLDFQLNRRVYCILGDGELDEGQNWEAVMFAGKQGLSNLIAIIDRNDIQLSGATEDIIPLSRMSAVWLSHGWQVITVDDGNDVDQIMLALASAKQADKPVVIIAHTLPGKGVSFMEGDYHWHGKVPSPDQAEQALAELGGND